MPDVPHIPHLDAQFSRRCYIPPQGGSAALHTLPRSLSLLMYFLVCCSLVAERNSDESQNFYTLDLWNKLFIL